MGERFNPREWIRLDREEIVLLRKVLTSYKLKTPSDSVEYMECIRLDNLLAGLLEDI